MSIAVKTKKKAKRRLLNLCSVLTVTKNNARNNEMKIVIKEIVTNKLILSINLFFIFHCLFLEFSAFFFSLQVTSRCLWSVVGVRILSIFGFAELRYETIIPLNPTIDTDSCCVLCLFFRFTHFFNFRQILFILFNIPSYFPVLNIIR